MGYKEERKAETAAVKSALSAAGINAHVTHGRGTASHWLEIYIGSPEQFGEHETDDMGSHANCGPCRRMNIIADQAHRIAAEASGRAGQYHEDISVSASKYWNGKEAKEIYQTAQEPATQAAPYTDRETRRQIRLNKAANRYAKRVRRGAKTVEYL